MSDEARAQTADMPEQPGVRSRIIVMASVVFLIFTLVSMGALHLYFGAQLKQGRAPETSFKAPRLQSHPLRDRAAGDEAEQRRLAGGMISIDRAMALIAARGAQAYDPVDAATTGFQERAR